MCQGSCSYFVKLKLDAVLGGGVADLEKSWNANITHIQRNGIVNQFQVVLIKANRGILCGTAQYV